MGDWLGLLEGARVVGERLGLVVGDELGLLVGLYVVHS